MTANAAPSTRSGALGVFALDGLVLVATKGLVGLAVLGSGFLAVSDDDFARVVISQRFADAPAADPSGTSWLPLPFWVYGAALRLFGSSLDVARAVALALGALSVLVLWWGAQVLGLSRRASALGAAIAGVFPYSAYLGAATVPEAPASALTVFGAFTLGSRRFRLLGAAALFAACAARYEPWAVAAVFSAFTAWDAARARDRRLALAAVVATAFPLLWIAHGVARHDEAFFFVSRVTAYRAALSPLSEPALGALLRVPALLVLREPELVLTACVAAVIGRATLRRAGPGPASRVVPRLLLTAAALLGFLMLGEVRGSAPTHHGERALLPIWFGLATLVGWGADRALLLNGPQRVRAMGAAAASAVLGSALVRPAWPRDAFNERSAEIDIGERARTLAVPRMAIETEDFGYFAIQAAFGSPNRTLVVHDRDPRREKGAGGSPLDPLTLTQKVADSGYPWLVLPTSRLGEFESAGRVRERNARFCLVELDPSGRARR